MTKETFKIRIESIFKDRISDTNKVIGPYTVTQLLGTPDEIIDEIVSIFSGVENEKSKELMNDVLRRHTWMKDGTTYVGSGTYTLKQAQEMMERDYPEIYGRK